VTRHCKYHCPHCRADAGPERTDELTTSQCKKILKAIARFTKCVLIFSGGEPMEREDIYELIRHACSLELKPVLATCGYLIDEKSIERLKKAGVASLVFLLDGAVAQTHDFIRQSDGSFDQIIRAAEIAHSRSVPFQINTTITKYNLAEVHAIAQLAQKIGAECFNPLIFAPTDRSEKVADLLLDPVEYEALLYHLLEMKLNSKMKIRVICGPSFARVVRQSNAEKKVGVTGGCVGGDGFGFISFNGDVQMCGFLDVSAGNLIEENFNFKKIWENSKLLNEIRDRSKYTGKCLNCDYRDFCGGCRARAYTACGDYLHTDPVCSYQAGEKD
jgi:AdoMet-dependent heme synthase